MINSFLGITTVTETRTAQAVKQIEKITKPGSSISHAKVLNLVIVLQVGALGDSAMYFLEALKACRTFDRTIIAQNITLCGRYLIQAGITFPAIFFPHIALKSTAYLGINEQKSKVKRCALQVRESVNNLAAKVISDPKAVMALNTSAGLTLLGLTGLIASRYLGDRNGHTNSAPQSGPGIDWRGYIVSSMIGLGICSLAAIKGNRRLRASNKQIEIFDQLKTQLSGGLSRKYMDLKAKVELRDRAVQLSSEYHNKTTFMERILSGNRDLTSSATEMSKVVDEDLYKLFEEGLVTKPWDALPWEGASASHQFARMMYDQLTNLDITSEELLALHNHMNKMYGESSQARLEEFARLGYPVARFSVEKATLENFEQLANEGLKPAQYWVVNMCGFFAQRCTSPQTNYAVRSHRWVAELSRSDSAMRMQEGINILVGFGTESNARTALAIAEELLSLAGLRPELQSQAEDLKTVATVLSYPLNALTRSNIKSCLSSLDRLFLSKYEQSIVEEKRNAFLEKLSDGGNAAASYLLYSCTLAKIFLERAAGQELPLAQSDWACELNRNKKTREAALELALKACEVDEKAKLLVAHISCDKGDLSLARKYALELVSSSDENTQQSAFDVLYSVLKVNLNKNSQLKGKFVKIDNGNSRIAYAFMLEHGLDVERNLDLANQQYALSRL